MSQPKDIDDTIEEDYNEEEDSDFEGQSDDHGSSSSDNEETDEKSTAKQVRSRKRQKTSQNVVDEPAITELDSGDEATIREREKEKRRSKKKGLTVEESDGDDSGWKAKTRSMREKEREEQHQRKLASTKGSTADIDQIFRDMQNSSADYDDGYLTALRSSKETNSSNGRDRPAEAVEPLDPSKTDNVTDVEALETITIPVTYRFAGETHTELKTVPRNSEEAQTFLAKQAKNGGSTIITTDGARLNENGLPLRRPLRKVSKFDPNINDPESFKKNWEKSMVQAKEISGPKINTVEKSRLDWVTHVDKAGLQEELSEHARGKKNYMGQRDFLDRVENVREEEARRARLGMA
ncbi:MAG: hypothetical protein Q9227_003904 [Pyrenula ochraceoflavens]